MCSPAAPLWKKYYVLWQSHLVVPGACLDVLLWLCGSRLPCLMISFNRGFYNLSVDLVSASDLWLPCVDDTVDCVYILFCCTALDVINKLWNWSLKSAVLRPKVWRTRYEGRCRDGAVNTRRRNLIVSTLRLVLWITLALNTRRRNLIVSTLRFYRQIRKLELLQSDTSSLEPLINTMDEPEVGFWPHVGQSRIPDTIQH